MIPDWIGTELIKPSDTHFIYMIQFDSNDFYIGQKSLKSKVKGKKVESQWRSYLSSSNVVANKIDKGEPFKRIILCADNHKSWINLLENVLIQTYGLQTNCINLAFISRGKLPKNEDKKSCRLLLNQCIESIDMHHKK